MKILTDRDTGRARGFAFVERSNSLEAERAIAGLNGSERAGRTLNANEAKPKTAETLGNAGQRLGGGRARDDYRGRARQPRGPAGSSSGSEVRRSWRVKCVFEQGQRWECMYAERPNDL